VVSKNVGCQVIISLYDRYSLSAAKEKLKENRALDLGNGGVPVGGVLQ
jgi:hypothetical protein